MQCYLIDKYTSYKFHEVLEMDFLLKELLYQCILYDYGVKDDSSDVDIDLDDPNLNVEELRKKIGWATDD